MNRQETTEFAVLAAIAILLPCVAGALLGWPIWLWIVLCVLLVGLAGLLTRVLRDRREQELLRREYLEQQASASRTPDEPEPFEQHAVAHLPLPSNEQGYRFVFGCTVCWRRSPNAMPHANPGSLAVTSVIARAREITTHTAPEDHLLAQHTAAAALGEIRPDDLEQVEAWATDISLVLPDADIERVRELTELRKRADLQERQRELERAARSYLADEVLQSPSTAVVWRLARHPDNVEETVRLIGALAQLSAVANETALPTRLWYLMPDEFRPYSSAEPPQFVLPPYTSDGIQLENSVTNGSALGAKPLAERISQLVDGLFDDPVRRLVFAEELATLLDSHGRTELADQLRVKPQSSVSGGEEPRAE